MTKDKIFGTILFVNDDSEDISEIKEKIRLLRRGDIIKETTVSRTLGFLENNQVGIIIFYVKKNNSSILPLLKDEKIKNIPKILIEKDCSSDFLLEAFDLNIDDIIHLNMDNWEISGRIIRLLNKSANKSAQEIKNFILYETGILDRKTDFFDERYKEQILDSIITNSIKNDIPSSILSLILKASKEGKAQEDFELHLKNSLRINDTIIKSGENNYYIFLENTTPKEAYLLFEKLKKTLNEWDFGAVISSVCDEKFSKTDKKIKEGLQKTTKTEGTMVIILNPLKDNDEDIIFSQNKKENLMLEKQDFSNIEQDESYEIFRQTYKKKCELVIGPVFKKLKSIIDSEKIPEIFIDYKVGFKKSKFEIITNSSEFYLTITYNGITKVNIETVHIANNKMFDIEPVEFDIMEFSNEKLMNYIEGAIQHIQL